MRLMKACIDSEKLIVRERSLTTKVGVERTSTICAGAQGSAYGTIESSVTVASTCIRFGGGGGDGVSTIARGRGRALRGARTEAGQALVKRHVLCPRERRTCCCDWLSASMKRMSSRRSWGLSSPIADLQ